MPHFVCIQYKLILQVQGKHVKILKRIIKQKQAQTKLANFEENIYKKKLKKKKEKGQLTKPIKITIHKPIRSFNI